MRTRQNKKHNIYKVLFLVIVLALTALAIVATNKKEEKIGANVLDNVAYTAEASTRATTIGDKYARIEANGEFLVLLITAKNLGDEKTNFYPYFEVESNDTKFKKAIVTEPLKRHDLQPFYGGGINKGETLTGYIVFDIPKGLPPDQLTIKSKEISKEKITLNIK